MALNNIGPLEVVIIACVGVVTLIVPIGVVAAVVYFSKRRPPGPPA